MDLIGFKKCCTQWNKSARNIFSLPYYISHPFYIRDIKFMHRMLNCNNTIVNQCIINTSHDANTHLYWL